MRLDAAGWAETTLSTPLTSDVTSGAAATGKPQAQHTRETHGQAALE